MFRDIRCVKVTGLVRDSTRTCPHRVTARQRTTSALCEGEGVVSREKHNAHAISWRVQALTPNPQPLSPNPCPLPRPEAEEERNLFVRAVLGGGTRAGLADLIRR